MKFPSNESHSSHKQSPRSEPSSKCGTLRKLQTHCEGCVFLWAGGGVGAVNFGNLATEKKKKWARVLTL